MVDQNGAYLFRKRGIYYFSKRIPSDLKHLYQVERLIQSLRTKCDRKAKSQAQAHLFIMVIPYKQLTEHQTTQLLWTLAILMIQVTVALQYP